MRLTLDDLNPFHFARRVKRRLQRMAMRPLFEEHRRALQQLRDRHRGGRCFILGNGPSLNRTDLGPLKNEITFGTNAIFLHYAEMGFEPTYYGVCDPLAEDRADEINALSGSTRFFPQDLVYCLKPAPDVVYLPFHYTNPEPVPRFSTDASKVVYLGATVTFMCLQLAYHLGCNPVYLIGMDHSYTRRHDAKGVMSDSADPDHFSPGYLAKGKPFNPYRCERVEQLFQLAREAFEADGRQIINATVGGKLEVFPRADYNEIVSTLHEKGRDSD